MADQRHSNDNRDRDDRLIRELEREHRLYRDEERRFSRAIGLTDFIAGLMVVATGFTAYATWRTAQVTSMVFATSDRPFVEVARVQFEEKASNDPYVAVDYRNFGRIPALDGMISVKVLIDGKPAHDPVSDEMQVSETGSIPPDIDHFVYRHLPPDRYKDVSVGKSALQLSVRIVYKGPVAGSEYCTVKRFVYDPRNSVFSGAGGTDKCKGNEVF